MPTQGQSSATLSSLIQSFLGLINTLIPIIIGFALLFFLWGCVQYIYNSAETKGKTEGRQAIIWGIVALFVIFSIWGIVNVLKSSLLP